MGTNIWLDNILGKKNSNAVSELSSVKIEELVGSLINLLKQHPDYDDVSNEELKTMAINVIVAESLHIQRHISKNSHIALFTNIIPNHPDLGDLRDMLKKTSYEVVKYKFRYLFVYCFTAGFLISQIVNRFLL